MLKIGEFSTKTNLSIRTLRYYDEIDLFKPCEIDLLTGYRYYKEEQIKELELITELKKIGFTLEEIRDNWGHFDDKMMLKKRNELLKKATDINTAIRKLDYLRSNIRNGTISLTKPQKKEKIKSLLER